MSDEKGTDLVKLNLSDEERKARSERAKKLVAEGKIGGNQGGGRPRKKRVTEVVNEKISKQGDAIAAAIIDNLGPDKPAHIRLQAARQAIDVEQVETRAAREELENLDGMSKRELALMIAAATLDLQEAGYLDKEMQDAFVPEDDVIEGVVVDDAA